MVDTHRGRGRKTKHRHTQKRFSLFFSFPVIVCKGLILYSSTSLEAVSLSRSLSLSHTKRRGKEKHVQIAFQKRYKEELPERLTR